MNAKSVTATLGLLANGSFNGWDVNVDETTSGPDRWFLQIEGPSIYFNFEIPSLDTISQVGRFLGARQTGRGSRSNAELSIGENKHAPVRLLRDDEFADRFFLVIGPADAPLVRYALSGVDLKSVVAALEQVVEDLEPVKA
jgi:hypothetical protein